MTGLKIGYARVSTDEQDLTAQRDALAALGVEPERIYVDHGLTGTNRDRPGLREALAACRAGDTLVVTKLDRLARSLPDARDIVDELTAAGVKLNLGGSVHDPNDPVGRLLFTVLSMIAEFEVRPRPGTDSRGHGRRQGEGPSARQATQAQPAQEAHLVELHRAGEHTISELEELFPSPAPPSIARLPAPAGVLPPSRCGQSAVRDGRAAGRGEPRPGVEAGLPAAAAAERRDGVPHLRHLAPDQGAVLLPGRQRR